MAVDWALKRFLKFVLKRKLGRYLHELDLDALDVELGSGTVELRQLLLKCDAITEDLVSARTLAAGSIIRSVVAYLMNSRRACAVSPWRRAHTERTHARKVCCTAEFEWLGGPRVLHRHSACATALQRPGHDWELLPR